MDRQTIYTDRQIQTDRRIYTGCIITHTHRQIDAQTDTQLFNMRWIVEKNLKFKPIQRTLCFVLSRTFPVHKIIVNRVQLHRSWLPIRSFVLSMRVFAAISIEYFRNIGWQRLERYVTCKSVNDICIKWWYQSHFCQRDTDVTYIIHIVPNGVGH